PARCGDRSSRTQHHPRRSDATRACNHRRRPPSPSSPSETPRTGEAENDRRLMQSRASSPWTPLPYDAWSATCDTLHAHTQVLGKLAVVLAPPEPQLQHAALRITARGWETLPLPAPDGSGALVVALDLHTHDAVVEHSDGRAQRVALARDRPV